jgi:hypothetical protein
MYAYAVDEMVQERRRELQRQRAAGGEAAPHGVPAWRRRTGRALASLAVTLGVPAADRTATRRQVGAALCFDPPC